MNVLPLPTENAWQGVQALHSMSVGVVADAQPVDVNAFIEKRASGTSISFRGRLRIPGIPSPIPEQSFTTSIIGKRHIIENKPESPWPKIRIELTIGLQHEKLRVESFLLETSDNTVDAEILSTRVQFYLIKAGKCDLYNVDTGKTIPFEISSFLEPEKEQIFVTRASLCRKLKYIQQVFRKKISLPTVISGDEIQVVEFLFRGITEGEFAVRGGESTLPGVSPADIDVTNPPFTGPGEFSCTLSSKISLFGQSFLVGPVFYILKKAEIANPRILDQIRKGLNNPIDLCFIVYDHQIKFRFESYTSEHRKRMRHRLERFKYELARKETSELVDIISESLEPDVSSDEAIQIAVGWTQYHDLPDRYCPQEPELDNDAGQWRVPIYLVYTSGEGGSVGEIIINVKTGVVISHTPIEELRSKGLALATQILHA